MFRKLSFLVAVLFATTLVGCEQQRKTTEPTNTNTDQSSTSGKIGNAESGTLTPGQETPASTSEETKKSS